MDAGETSEGVSRKTKAHGEACSVWRAAKVVWVLCHPQGQRTAASEWERLGSERRWNGNRA